MFWCVIVSLLEERWGVQWLPVVGQSGQWSTGPEKIDTSDFIGTCTRRKKLRI